jgi:hypothetical protein
MRTKKGVILGHIKGFSLGVLVMVCWLLFATVYSAFKHYPGRVRDDYELEEIQLEDVDLNKYYTSTVYKDESSSSAIKMKVELYDIKVVDAYLNLKKIDEKDSLIKDTRSAAQAVQDLCIELSMENCL